MEINDGGSAFPEVETSYSNRWDGDSGGYANTYSVGGMTLRDWFAGQALAGLCGDVSNMTETPDQLARAAYAAASAMLKAREGK